MVPQMRATPLAERILLLTLFVTVLASSVAFIEPSPHDGLMGVLALACLTAGVRFPRMLAIPPATRTAMSVASSEIIIPHSAEPGRYAKDTSCVPPGTCTARNK